MTEKTDTKENVQKIEITASAVTEAKRLMTLEKNAPAYLRVGVEAGGCSGMSYSLSFDDKASESDIHFEFEDLKVVVASKALPYLAGTVLDFKTGLVGAGFSFNNPSAKRSCGCGSSFTC